MAEVQDEQPFSHKSATTTVMENVNCEEPPPKYQKISRENTLHEKRRMRNSRKIDGRYLAGCCCASLQSYACSYAHLYLHDHIKQYENASHW